MAAMTQWCSSAARRMMMPQMPPLVGSSSSLLSSSSVAEAVPILCGRGDKKTKKGKRFKGSYGNARPKKEKKIERIKDRIEVPSSDLISSSATPLLNYSGKVEDANRAIIEEWLFCSWSENFC